MQIYANLLDYTTDERTGQIVSGSRTEPVKFREYWTLPVRWGIIPGSSRPSIRPNESLALPETARQFGDSLFTSEAGEGRSQSESLSFCMPWRSSFCSGRPCRAAVSLPHHRPIGHSDGHDNGTGPLFPQCGGPLPPASITKVLSLYLADEAIREGRSVRRIR